jgi:hypothetical protein
MKKILISLYFFFIAAISFAQPATQAPGIFYKYAFTQAWGGIPLPLYPTNYGAPLTLYKPLLEGFSVTDALDVAAFRPKSMSPTLIGGGEIEIFGNTNIAYPSTADVYNPFVPVKIFTSHLALNNDGELFLGGRIPDSKIKSLQYIGLKRVKTKQRAAPLTNEITEKNLISLGLSLWDTEDRILGIAMDPRPGKQNLIYLSMYSEKLKRKILIYIDSDQEDQSGVDPIFVEEPPVGLSNFVGGNMVIDKKGILYMADPDLHIVVSVDLSSDNDKEKQELVLKAKKTKKSK